MPVTISGSTGIQNVLGSASAPAESNTTSSNTGLYFPTSTTLGLSTAGTNALYVDASQNVGIGTISPSSPLNVVSASSSLAIAINGRSSDNLGAMYFYANNGSTQYSTITASATEFRLSSVPAAAVQTFYTNSSERMRIDTSGNLLVGTTSSVNGGSAISVASGTVCSIITALTTNTNMIVFRNGNGNVGTISTSGTSTSFNTSSDYRLKHDVEPMTTGLATVSALKPVTYKWNADNGDGEGFIAHELAEVIPLAVTGAKDAVDADGKPQYQGVDYSKIVVHLVAALQELDAKFEAYKAAHP